MADLGTRRAARLVVDACIHDRHVVPTFGKPMVCGRCAAVAWQILFLADNDVLFDEYLQTSPSRQEATV